jgi:hypothetical protein
MCGVQEYTVQFLGFGYRYREGPILPIRTEGLGLTVDDKEWTKYEN